MKLASDIIAANASPINAVQTETSICVSGGFIYVSYIDAEQRVTIAKRPVEGGEWTSATVGDPVLFDAHNGAAIGIDPQGHIHTACDLHGSSFEGKYFVSADPDSLSAFVPGPPIPAGTPSSAVSYPRFYPAGSQLYMLFRDGSPAGGDIWLLRWGTEAAETVNSIGTWVEGRMLIAGTAFGMGAYLGSCAGLPDGSLLLIWTYRVSQWYNRGVHVARYYPDGSCQRPDGSFTALPLTPAEPDISGDGVADTISNVSLNIGAESDGTIHVAFARHQNGYREIFHGVKTPACPWIVRQVTAARAPVLDACPVPISGDHPRPCHMQIQGPTMILDRDTVQLYWARSVAPSIGSWARPPGISYVSVSGDRGRSWRSSPAEIERHVSDYLGEMPRESGGLPYLLAQTLAVPNGRLELLECPSALSEISAVGSIRASLSSNRYIELDSAPIATPAGFAISAWVRPEPIAREMSVIDRGGAYGKRELRLMIWGSAIGSPLHYDTGRVQVLIGDTAGGWGLIWYPAVVVLPGIVSHIGISYDGASVSLYLNGVLAASTVYSSGILPSSSRTLIGACRSILGGAERTFEGELAVEWFCRPLSAEAMAVLADIPLGC